MKTLSLAIAGAASLALAACGSGGDGSDEALQENAAVQSENLDALSANAANAAEAEALGSAEQQPETATENASASQNAAAAVDNGTEDEEPVQGM